MSFKIGGTTVIDNNGNINWSRIVGEPSSIYSAVTKVAISNCGASGNYLTVSRTGRDVTVGLRTSNCNCQCDCVCRD